MTIQSPPYGTKRHNHQVVLINMQGFIYESCDSLFSTEQYLGMSLKHLCYFFEGELDSIINCSKTKITFEKIKIEFKYLPGSYDFVFSKQELNGEQFVLWEIYDYTSIYEEYTFIQQLQNEIAILEQLNKKGLGSAKDNLEFFQSGYTSNEISNVNKLIAKTIESKFKGFHRLFNEAGELNKDIDLIHLKSCVKELGFEINYFTKQLKSTQIELIDIRSLFTSTLNSSSFNFAADVPTKVAIDKGSVKKILGLLSLQYALTPSSNVKRLDVTFHQSLSDRSFISIALNENAKFVRSSVCAFICLSLLKSLISMIGGDLTVGFQENESIFQTKMDIPIE